MRSHAGLSEGYQAFLDKAPHSSDSTGQAKTRTRVKQVQRPANQVACYIAGSASRKPGRASRKPGRAGTNQVQRKQVSRPTWANVTVGWTENLICGIKRTLDLIWRTDDLLWHLRPGLHDGEPGSGVQPDPRGGGGLTSWGRPCIVSPPRWGHLYTQGFYLRERGSLACS